MKDRLNPTISGILFDNIWDSIERPVFNFTTYNCTNSILVDKLDKDIRGIVDRCQQSVQRSILTATQDEVERI